MEAKGFFSKSSNIFSVAVLLVGVTMFTSGVIVVHNQAEKSYSEISSKNAYIQKVEGELSEKRVELKQKDLKISALEKENGDLKKKIETYKNRSESPSSPRHRVVSVEATAYIANCTEGCTGITASGDNIKNTTKVDGMRVIATDTDVIPMYSLVKVETNGETFYAQALDKGGGINGYEIDVLVRNESVARDFGRQNVKVTILREGKGS